jgi:hypothetical protein
MKRNIHSYMAAGVMAILLPAATAHAVLIDNDIAVGTLGYWAVDVATGGDSVKAYLTAQQQASNNLITEDVLYDYFTYVDVGNGGFRLSGTAPSLVAEDSVQSSGSFVGDSNQNIDWTVTSSIADGSMVMTNVFEFTAEKGSTLGYLRLFQYMDEDFKDFDDDLLLVRGSVASDDLKLFTLDNQERYGVSHFGAMSADKGLVNTAFTGWAAGVYNNVKPKILEGTQNVSPAGEINNLASFNDPELGSVHGPNDIVLVLAWTVDPDASSATVITALGGVHDITTLPPATSSVPEPALLALAALGMTGFGWRRRKSS